MKRLFCFCCLTLAVVLPKQTLHAATAFYFTSSPQSWIGQGLTQTSTNVSASVTYNLGAYSDSVHFGTAGDFGLTIVGPGLTLPSVGFYTNATRWPFQGSGPGLDFTGPGRGNNTLTGYFNVLQADYDTNGQVASFAVDFMQYDEGFSAWWNKGSVRYNSNIAIPEPSTTVLVLVGLLAICMCVHRERISAP
jgi:hypothetical protein